MVKPLVVDPTLSVPQVKIYEALREAWEQHGLGPSQHELRAATGYSTTTIIQSLKALRNKGHIVYPKFGIRGARPVDVERHLLREEPPPWDDLDETAPPRYWA